MRLFANLARYLPGGDRGASAALEVPEGTTVQELVGRLAIPEDLPRLLLVNGRDAAPEHPLDPGDIVSILPPLVGG